MFTLSHVKIPPPYHGWLCYIYDEFPNKKNFVEPKWRPPRSFQMRMLHPQTSNYHNAPNGPNNILKEENFNFHIQKSYLEFDPKKIENQYDKVKLYDITKEN